MRHMITLLSANSGCEYLLQMAMIEPSESLTCWQMEKL
jgi:hypothetical protein